MFAIFSAFIDVVREKQHRRGKPRKPLESPPPQECKLRAGASKNHRGEGSKAGTHRSGEPALGTRTKDDKAMFPVKTTKFI
jgi:hypothetical protein